MFLEYRAFAFESDVQENGNATHDPNVTSPVAAGKPYLQLLFKLDALVQIFIPFYASLGILGNVLSAVTLLQTTLRRQAASHFLTAKCVADSVFLLSLLFLWLKSLGVDVYNGGVMCHVESLLTGSSHFLNMWFMLCLAMERYLVVCRPQCPSCSRGLCCDLSHVCDIGTRQDTAQKRQAAVVRAKLCCVALSILALIVYLNISLTVTVMQDVRGVKICVPNLKFYRATMLMGHIDVFLNVMLPFVMTAAFTALTIKSTLQYKLTRNKTLSGQRLTQAQRFYPCSEKRVTKLICLMCLTFIVFSGPTHSIRIMHMFRQFYHTELRIGAKEYFYQQVFHVIYYLTFSFNFMLLLLFHKGFRKAIRLVFLRCLLKVKVLCRPKPPEDNSALVAMSFAFDFSSKLVNLRLDETSLR